MARPDEDLHALLAARGFDVQAVSKLTTGQKNATLLVETPHGDRFAVRRYATATSAEVEYELAAVEYLSAHGFPTPAPLRDRDGSLAGSLGGRLAAVFQFAGGSHAVNLESWPRPDLELGVHAAALAGRLHRLTQGVTFPGRRTERLDPLRRITEFLDGPYAALPALAEIASPLASLSEAMTKLYASAALPRGLVHNDISAHNLLLSGDPDGITALIDFDDCMTSFLIYDLGRIVEVWGSGADGRLDRSRVRQLIDAYSRERILTADERRHAEAFIAAYAAATGIGVLTGKVRNREAITGPGDSIAMDVALQLLQR